MGKNKNDDDDVSEDGFDPGEDTDDEAERFTLDVIRDEDDNS